MKHLIKLNHKKNIMGCFYYQIQKTKRYLQQEVHYNASLGNQRKKQQYMCQNQSVCLSKSNDNTLPNKKLVSFSSTDTFYVSAKETHHGNKIKGEKCFSSNLSHCLLSKMFNAILHVFGGGRVCVHICKSVGRKGVQ